MKKKEVSAIALEYGLSPNKRLGQNFLVDEGLTEKILSLIAPKKSDSVLEIGPGMGALTVPLSERAGRLTAVELDSGLYRYLSDRFSDSAGVSIVHMDFLKYRTDDTFTKVVSNLPYYCASEILFKASSAVPDADLYVMLQKEMAERINGTPGTASYGAFTVTLGYYYTCTDSITVPGESFFPRPDVSSSFIKLKRKAPVLTPEETLLFHVLVKSAFWGRRKTLSKALADSPHMKLDRHTVSQALEAASVSGTVRGEELGIDDYCRMAETFYKIMHG